MMIELLSRAELEAPDTSRSLELRHVSILCVALASIGVLLRCFVRGYIVRAFTFDDWLFVVCLGVNLASNVMCYQMVLAGLGRHIVDLPIEARVETFKNLYIAEQLYVASTTFVKVAYGFFYLRILSEPWVYRADPQFHRRAARILYALILVSILFAIAYGLTFIFQCAPISHMWTQFAGSKGSCIDKHIIVGGTYVHSSINAILDLIFAVIPIPVMWKMQIGWRTKSTVLIVLGVGCVPCISTFIRFQYIPTINFDHDATYTFEKLAMWSAVEPSAALFASGLAVSKPLINLIVNRIRGLEPYDHPDKLIINVQVEEKTFEFDKSDDSSVLGATVVKVSPTSTLDGSSTRNGTKGPGIITTHK